MAGCRSGRCDSGSGGRSPYRPTRTPRPTRPAHLTSGRSKNGAKHPGESCRRVPVNTAAARIRFTSFPDRGFGVSIPGTTAGEGDGFETSTQSGTTDKTVAGSADQAIQNGRTAIKNARIMVKEPPRLQGNPPAQCQGRTPPALGFRRGVCRSSSKFVRTPKQTTSRTRRVPAPAHGADGIVT